MDPCLQMCDVGSKESKHAVQRMRSTIMEHNNNIPLADYKIEKVYKIHNPVIEKLFNAKKAQIEGEIGGRTEIWETFHGSPYAEEIAKEGFKVSRSSELNMFGRGVYFAPHSSKSNQYAWGNNGCCPAHNNKACTDCVRKILICLCIMGRQFKPSQPRQDAPAGYHSMVADPQTNPAIAKHLIYPEYVIKNGEQVKPVMLIEYKIISKGRSMASKDFKNAFAMMVNPVSFSGYFTSMQFETSSSDNDSSDSDKMNGKKSSSSKESSSSSTHHDSSSGENSESDASEEESSDNESNSSSQSDLSFSDPSDDSDQDQDSFSDADSD